MGFEIDKLTAFIVVHPDGDEAIIMVRSPDGYVPLICADEKRFREIYPMALEVAKKSGLEFKILQFSHRSDVTEQYRKLPVDVN